MSISKMPCGMPYMAHPCVASHLEGPILNWTGSVLFLTLTPPIYLKPAAMHLEIIGAEVSIEIVAFQEAPSLQSPRSYTAKYYQRTSNP